MTQARGRRGKPGDDTAGRIALIGNQAFTTVKFRGPLIRDLTAAGYRVWALAPDYDDTTRAWIRELGARPVDYPLDRTVKGPFREIRSLFALWRILRRLRADVCLAYFVKPVIYGTVAAWLAGVPRRVALIEGAGYVFGDEAVSTRRGRLLRRTVTALYRFALHRAHRVVVLNRDDYELFADTGMAPPGRLDMLPGIGVDLRHYARAAPASGPLTFTLAARLIEEKGVRVFAQAARRLGREFPDTRFLLLGGLDEGPGALGREEVEGWVTEGLLEWPGRVPDVRPYLRETSVFVLPSHYREGLPRGILEAMAMGRPVITTDNPGCRDAVVDGESGFLVPVRDPAALAEAMRRFAARPELIAELGAGAHERAERLYDVRAVNKRLISILNGDSPE